MLARGYHKVCVTLLEELLKKYHLTPEKIYNVDETGLAVNPKEISKIIAVKSKRQLGALASRQRCELVTTEISFYAAGANMPLILIYPRKRMQ